MSRANRRRRRVPAVIDPAFDAKRGSKRDDEIRDVIGDGHRLRNPQRGLSLLNRPREKPRSVHEDAVARRNADYQVREIL